MNIFGMNPEDFKNFFQGIQAIAISLTALAGGIWGVFKLYSSKELDKSRLEALQKRKEFEKRQGLSGQIDVKLGTKLPNGNIPVFLNCKIVNESSETLTLDWNQFPLKIAVIEKTKNEYSYWLKEIAKLALHRINPIEIKIRGSIIVTTTLLPNSERILPFYWESDQPGIYLAGISAMLPDSLSKYMKTSDEDGILNKAIERDSKKYPKRHGTKMKFYITEYFQIDYSSED